MKIGILTFHDAHNYGAVLQAYALKTYLKGLGHNTRIINYHHENLPYGFPRENNPIRWEKFEVFIKELIDNDEKVYIREEELEKLDIDAWICGSDQIWNTEITGFFNNGLFLNFNTNAKKISYAVSMGIKRLPKEYEEQFRHSLKNLDSISVREETLKEYAKEFVDKNITRTLDPTLLIEEKDYEDLILENNYGKYILIYELVPDKRLIEVAEKLSIETGLKIIELNDKKKANYSYNQISDAGPDEFLTLIKNAKFVVTNSFHGTIFSIIFKKEFFTITRTEDRNTRLENILNIVDMKDRLIDNTEDFYKVKKQDYKKAYVNLRKEKQKSIDFLKDALK